MNAACNLIKDVNVFFVAVVIVAHTRMWSLKLDTAAGKAMQLHNVYGTTCCSSFTAKGLSTTKKGGQKLFGRVSEALCNPPLLLDSLFM